MQIEMTNGLVTLPNAQATLSLRNVFILIQLFVVVLRVGVNSGHNNHAWLQTIYMAIGVKECRLCTLRIIVELLCITI